MLGLHSLVFLVTALLLSFSHARLPYQQGASGYVADINGNYQSIPDADESHLGSSSPDDSSDAPTDNAPTSNIPYTSTGTARAQRAHPTYVYGTNAGGHLIVEKWMTPDLFEGTDATDQWSLDQTDGAEKKLKNHWDTYYTKQDFVAMKKWGINTVRIPIGYWAYDNSKTPYLQGADYYLERMIEWCREIGLWVLVDCHGSPGSQNGFDNSGRAGKAHWQTDDNLQRSTAVLKTMAQKYGSMKYADVVWGIQLVNEPISWNGNKLEKTQQWTQEAYPIVRAAAANKDLMILMHDGFMGPSKWVETGKAINRETESYNTESSAGSSSGSNLRFAIDTHLYQNQAPEDKNLTQQEHIRKACAWKHTNLLSQQNNSADDRNEKRTPKATTNNNNATNNPVSLPVYIGEFSAATDICANPDGSTLAGTACYINGCQCANNVDIQHWAQPLKDATREFFEAELETFENAAQGWFVWSWKGPGGGGWRI
ncbi:hypothetical protein Q7P37_010979 [Cladosporium fusiforme]